MNRFDINIASASGRKNILTNSRRPLAIFLPAMHQGGAERTMANLSRGIAERGYAVDLVLARAEGPHLVEVPDSVRIVDLHAHRVLASLPRLVLYLRREQPQAMLSVMNHANIVALWARRLAGGPKRVVVNEQNTISRTTQDASNQRGWAMPRLVKYFYPWADDIIAVSKGVADDLARVTGIPRERVQVVHNAVVTSETLRKSKAILEHPWFKPGEPPVVLGVGRLRAQKDFTTLIQAFAHVRRTCPARLLILGEGSERSTLETLIKQLNLEQEVSLPGFFENPFAYMSQAALFVLSSRWEGLPTVLIEALCCGTRVVSTDCPSGPREILAEGRFGQLVPVGEINAMASAIEANLSGQVPPPPSESWRPFKLEVVVSQYVNILLGHP